MGVSCTVVQTIFLDGCVDQVDNTRTDLGVLRLLLPTWPPQLSGVHVLKSIFLVLDTFPASLSIATTQSQTTTKQNSKSAGRYFLLIYF